MWKISAINNFFCYKFDFEVPLEDLFVQTELHPKITLMYSTALECFIKNKITSETISNEKDEKPEDKMELKRMMLNSSYLQGSPQSFLWLIEHFLGMLPIPLLTNYTNKKYLEWIYLSKKCKKLFQIYHRERRIAYDLDYDIIREISKLPAQHYLLLNLHMIFMREISFVINKNKNIGKRNAIYYTRYFSPSIFIRPFRPGLKQNTEREYDYIMLYMLLRWPFLQEMYRYSSLPTIMELPETITENELNKYNEKIYLDDLMKQKEVNILHKQTYLNSNSCCCAIGSNYTSNSDSGSIRVLYQNSSPRLSENSMRSTECGTISVNNENMKAANDEQSKIENHLQEIAEESFIYDDYDTFEKEDFNQINDRDCSTMIKYSQSRLTHPKSVNRITSGNNASLETKIGNDCPLTRSLHLTSQENNLQKETETKFENRTSKTNEEYFKTNINHPASNLTVEKNVSNTEHYIKNSVSKKGEHNKREQKIKNQPENGNKSEKPIPQNQKPITIDTTLMKRVTKLGWTYTRPKNSKTEVSGLGDLSKDEITNEILIDNSKSETSVKKYKSVRSLKSKLSFLSINKKIDRNKNDSSNLKYIKINS